MMCHPRAYWTYPETERRRRLIAAVVGALIGGAATAGALLIWGAA